MLHSGTVVGGLLHLTDFSAFLRCSIFQLGALALVYMFCFGLSVAQGADTNGTSGGNLPPSTATPVQINILECLGAFDSQAQSVLVCYNYPDLYSVLKFAEQVGQQECQSRFQGSKWNCSTFSILKSPIIANKSTRDKLYLPRV